MAGIEERLKTTEKRVADLYNKVGESSGVPSAGGSAPVQITKAAITTLINTNSLVPGTIYKITGVHPTLYNDGTNSGTTIYLTALTTNTLSKDGHGEFWNPKYAQATTGFGIWDSTMTIPAIGSKTIWGGYSWTSVNGTIGDRNDILSLNSAWSKNPYTPTDYNKVLDIIEYDITHDWIERRYEVEGSNEVIYTYSDYVTINWDSAISVFMWGNIFNSNYRGVARNKILNSYFECVDFKGRNLTHNVITGASVIKDNSYVPGTYFFEHNEISDYSELKGNIFSLAGGITKNYMRRAFMSTNTLANGTIHQNRLINSNIGANYIVSYIRNNELLTSQIINNTLNGASGEISDNKLINSFIRNNTINNVRLQFSSFNSSTFDTANVVISQHIKYVNQIGVSSASSAGTILYLTTPKTVYTRPDGSPRIQYINDADILTIGLIGT